MEQTPLLTDTSQGPIDLSIDHPSEDLIQDVGKSPEIIVRSLIPMSNSVAHSRRLGVYSTVVIFIGRILGSGILATPGLVLKDAQGSYSLYLSFWLIAGIIAYTGLSLYLELGSYLPINGATKTFLEYIFPNPRLCTTVVFSVFTLLFSFSSANALVFGEYTRYALGYSESETATRHIAALLIVACSVLHGFSKSVGIKAQNMLGTFKLFMIGITVVTCAYVLLLPDSWTGLKNQMTSDHFKFPPLSTLQGSAYAMALLKCIHSFGGWTTCHTIQNEIKDPIHTLAVAGPASIIVIICLYIMLNLCYLKVIPYKDLIGSDQLAGGILFTKVYGKDMGRLIINLFVAISAATNVMIVVYTDSIMNQEVFRAGFLPFSDKLCTNWPYGTPLWGILVHCVTSCVVIYVPKRTVYNWIIGVQYYPNQLFHTLLCLGLLFKLRPRFPNIHAPIRARTGLIYLCLAGSLSVVLSPFLSGSFTFTLASLSVLLLGYIYWLVVFVLLPKWGNYRYIPYTYIKSDGLSYTMWDAEPL